MNENTTCWKFSEAPNVAVFTSKGILQNGDWVYYVTHDQDDGVWQFHPYSGIVPCSEMVVSSLRSLVDLDRSLELLADLPTGWHAWRDSPSDQWQREPSRINQRENKGVRESAGKSRE